MSDEAKKSKSTHVEPQSPKAPPADFTNPRSGDLAIDARAIASFVIDLPPGGMLGLRTEQDGYDEAVHEIIANQAKFGGTAGVTAADIEVLTTSDAQIAIIDRYLGPAAKLVELLTETRAKLDDARQRKVTTIANTVDLRAKDGRDEGLLAVYEKARSYRSVIGAKAAKTRQRKAAAAEAEAKSASAGKADPTPA
jgi:hypothetical protein